MSAPAIEPLSKQQIQVIRALAQTPELRPKAVELAGLVRTNRDQIQTRKLPQSPDTT